MVLGPAVKTGVESNKAITISAYYWIEILEVAFSQNNICQSNRSLSLFVDIPTRILEKYGRRRRFGFSSMTPAPSCDQRNSNLPECTISGSSDGSDCRLGGSKQYEGLVVMIYPHFLLLYGALSLAVEGRSANSLLGTLSPQDESRQEI